MHQDTLRLVGRDKQLARLKKTRKNPPHIKHSRNVPEMLLSAELLNGLYMQVPLTRELTNMISGYKERRLRVFENRMLRRVFGPKRDEVTGEWRNYIMRSFVICTPYPILCG